MPDSGADSNWPLPLLRFFMTVGEARRVPHTLTAELVDDRAQWKALAQRIEQLVSGQHVLGRSSRY
jgi:hypothetical protein